MFLHLGDTEKGYIMALCIVSVVFVLITLIAYIVEKKKRILTLSLFFMFAASVLDLALIMHLNKVDRVKYNITLTPIISFLNTIPYYVHIALSIIIIVVAVAAFYYLYKNNKYKINTFSVKQALENLPTGILFMSDSNELLLSNHIIHNLSKQLTGKTLQSGTAFWQHLTALQNENNCVIKGEEPAFVLSSDNVWQFSKNVCTYNGEKYYEIKAIDITELYKLSESARDINEKLTQQQKRLKKLTNIIEKNAESQVAVNMKIRFHDNFGNLLTLTKKALRENENSNDVRTLFDYWGNLSSVIKELSQENRHSISLEQIMVFAEKLGCEIEINGEIPKQEQSKVTLLLCVNEMLKNAYRHANAQKLTVNITETNATINFTVQNETKHNVTSINEGSGLLGLRQRIEQAGGKMSMECDRAVTMNVSLIKGSV